MKEVEPGRAHRQDLRSSETLSPSCPVSTRHCSQVARLLKSKFSIDRPGCGAEDDAYEARQEEKFLPGQSIWTRCPGCARLCCKTEPSGLLERHGSQHIAGFNNQRTAAYSLPQNFNFNVRFDLCPWTLPSCHVISSLRSTGLPARSRSVLKQAKRTQVHESSLQAWLEAGRISEESIHDLKLPKCRKRLQLRAPPTPIQTWILGVWSCRSPKALREEENLEARRVSLSLSGSVSSSSE